MHRVSDAIAWRAVWRTAWGAVLGLSCMAGSIESAIAAEPAVPPSADLSAPAASLAQAAETYREPSGLFEISFPPGYTYWEIDGGIAFNSGDRRFGGSVTISSAQGETVNLDQVAQALKQAYEQRFADVTWQDSAPQPDGSLRLDWTGTLLPDRRLDAISFVEQRGDTVFILNLFGINAPYNNQDAEFIVQSYRPQGTPASTVTSLLNQF